MEDRICIIYSMSVPFVVREESGGFCLMGECYVQDAIDGKAMQVEPVDTQEITLLRASCHVKEKCMGLSILLNIVAVPQ